MVDVKDVSAYELIRTKIPPDAARDLLDKCVLEFGLRPRMYLYVGPKLSSTVRLVDGETLTVKGRPTIMAHEFMTSFRTLRKQAMDASVVYAGPPGYEDVVEEVFEWLVVVPTD